jgi:hypothetical protein
MGSAAVAELRRWLIPGAPLALLFLGGALLSPWVRYFAVYMGLVAAPLLLGAVLTATVRSRHSRGYLAKWIDLENQLEDRLASAVEWDALPQLDGFQQRCVETLATELASRRLELPRTRPRNLLFTLTAAMVLTAALAFSLGRRAPEREADATEKVKLAAPVAAGAGEAVKALGEQVASLEDVQLAQLASDLSVLVQKLDAGSLDRERSLAELERLRREATQLGATRAGGASLDTSGSGALGPLARALASGDLKSAEAALDRVSGQLAAGSLADEEVARLRTLVGALASVAESASAPDGAALLRKVADKLGDADPAASAQQLAAAKGLLPSLMKHLSAAGAAERAAQVSAALERSLGPDAPEREVVASLKAPHGPAAAGAGQPLPSGQTSLLGQNGAGDGVVAEPRSAPPHTPSDQGSELRPAGVWNGRVLRELFTDSGSAPSDEVRRLLVEHERVAEQRFERDEIPGQYTDAVRAYFAGLHARGGSWTPTRK